MRKNKRLEGIFNALSSKNLSTMEQRGARCKG